jgi:hypothetical protein
MRTSLQAELYTATLERGCPVQLNGGRQRRMIIVQTRECAAFTADDIALFREPTARAIGGAARCPEGASGVATAKLRGLRPWVVPRQKIANSVK